MAINDQHNEPEPAGATLRLTGRCSCGEVSFSCVEPASLLSHCHCSECRRAYGAAFGSIVVAPRSGFRFASGEASISRFAASARVTRFFCSQCGSPLPLVEDWDPLVGIPLGLLDDPDGFLQDIPVQHIFAADSLTCLATEGPRFDAWPPGDDGNDRADELRK